MLEQRIVAARGKCHRSQQQIFTATDRRSNRSSQVAATEWEAGSAAASVSVSLLQSYLGALVSQKVRAQTKVVNHAFCFNHSYTLILIPGTLGLPFAAYMKILSG